jgi:hypothetical protein
MTALCGVKRVQGIIPLDLARQLTETDGAVSLAHVVSPHVTYVDIRSIRCAPVDPCNILRRHILCIQITSVPTIIGDITTTHVHPCDGHVSGTLAQLKGLFGSIAARPSVQQTLKAEGWRPEE